MHHPSHFLRFSDSSLYDHKCTYCGLTDNQDLSQPCKEVKKIQNSSYSGATADPDTVLLYRQQRQSSLSRMELNPDDASSEALEQKVREAISDIADRCGVCGRTDVHDINQPCGQRSEDATDMTDKHYFNDFPDNKTPSIPTYRILGRIDKVEDLPINGNTIDGEPLMDHDAYAVGDQVHVWSQQDSIWVPLYQAHLIKGFGGDHDGNVGWPGTDEQQYLNLLGEVLENGTYKADRTGVGCYSIRGAMMRFDLTEGKIPLLTTKQMGIKSIVAELLWFLSGSTNAYDLNEIGAKIWDEWATTTGDLGPIYGEQWTAWEVPDKGKLNSDVDAIMEEVKKGTDEEGVLLMLSNLKDDINNPPAINQIEQLVTSLKENPNSRRILVTGWNPGVLPAEYEWEYHNFQGLDSLPDVCEWEKLTGKQRADLFREDDCTGNLQDVPTHRRKVRLSPQDNVRRGKAALPACHTMFQVHTRALDLSERLTLLEERFPDIANDDIFEIAILALDENDPEGVRLEREVVERLNSLGVPHYALTLQMFQRSCDLPIGVPYNIASYGILAQLLAKQVGMIAEELIWMGGDCHIYSNQIEGVNEQLQREPTEPPTLHINLSDFDITQPSLNGLRPEHFELMGYAPQSKIDFGDIAV